MSIKDSKPKRKSSNKPASNTFILKAALAYAAHGWAVFPCYAAKADGSCTCGDPDCGRDAGKHPYSEFAPNGFKSASTNPATITKWFGPDSPPLNLALATGKDSRVSVVDIDMDAGKVGAETWAALIAEHGEPQTLLAKTGGGGVHAWFTYNENLKTGNDRLGKHVDIKNDDAYVMVAPSNHRLGGTYEWLGPWDVPLLAVPEWMTEKKKQKKKTPPQNDEPTYTLAQVTGMLDVIPADARGDWLNFGTILGRAFNCSDEAWEVYVAWTEKWTGLKGRGHDKAMHTAFYVTSQEATDNPVSLGTIVFKARQHGWVEEEVRTLNATHAVVMVGGRCVVLTEVDEQSRKTITLSRSSDFTLYYKNRHVQRGTRRMDLGTYWLQHPARRQYARVVFAPEGCDEGQYNLWRGFAVKPVKGDCARYLEHLRWTICRGNVEHYEWLVAWMAHIVQHPATLAGTSVVLRGQEGTGKGMMAKWFGRLFGQHYVPLSKSRHLTGNFNAHLREAVLVYADEAFYAGDRSAEGALKALITEERHLIEFKGIDAIPVDNYTHLLISSNAEWVVPTGKDARRFFVLDVGPTHRGDHTYFGAIEAQMEHGGCEALLYELLHHTYSEVNLRVAPKTLALMEQKEFHMTPFEKFWFACLVQGDHGSPFFEDGPDSKKEPGWNRLVKTSDVYDRYIKHAGDAGVTRRGTEMELAKQLRTLVPGLQNKRRWHEKHYFRCWEFPTLADCRAAFDKHMNWTYRWEKSETDQTDHAA